MKKYNEFVSLVENKLPVVYGNLSDYGKGHIIQVIVLSSTSEAVKKDAKPGIYIKDNIKHNIKMIEVLYTTRAEEKLYTRELVNNLHELLDNQIVYISYLDVQKDKTLMQFYILDEINKLKF